jgi:hypothetical protein
MSETACVTIWSLPGGGSHPCLRARDGRPAPWRTVAALPWSRCPATGHEAGGLARVNSALEGHRRRRQALLTAPRSAVLIPGPALGGRSAFVQFDRDIAHSCDDHHSSCAAPLVSYLALPGTSLTGTPPLPRVPANPRVRDGELRGIHAVWADPAPGFVRTPGRRGRAARGTGSRRGSFLPPPPDDTAPGRAGQGHPAGVALRSLRDP